MKIDLTEKELESKNQTIEKANQILAKIRLCEGCKVLAGTENYTGEPRLYRKALNIFESFNNEIDFNEAVAFSLLKVSDTNYVLDYKDTLKALGTDKLLSFNFDYYPRWRESVLKACKDATIEKEMISDLNKARIIIGLDSYYSPYIPTMSFFVLILRRFARAGYTSSREAIETVFKEYSIEQIHIDAALADCVMD